MEVEMADLESAPIAAEGAETNSNPNPNLLSVASAVSPGRQSKSLPSTSGSPKHRRRLSHAEYDEELEIHGNGCERCCDRYCICVPRKSQPAVREMFTYALFLTTFTVLLLAREDFDLYATRYSFQLMARDRFVAEHVEVNGTEYSFNRVNSVPDLWDWLAGPFVESLVMAKTDESSGALLDPLTTSREAAVFFFAHSAILGNVRMWQKRVVTESCPVMFDLPQSYRRWAESQRMTVLTDSNGCFPKFDEDDESTAPFGPSLEFTYSDDPQASINSKLFSPNPTFGDGGFVQDLPMPPNEGNTTDLAQRLRAQLADLRSKDWLDRQTSALMVDFTLFNPSTRYFCAVRVMFMMLTPGGVQPHAFFRVHSFYNYETNWDWFYLALDCVFWCFVLLYIVDEVREIVALRGEYLRVPWNYADLLNLTIFLGVLVLRVLTDISAAELRDEVESGVQYVNFQPLAYTRNQLNNLSSFNAVLCWIKVFKYLGISPQMSQLTRVLDRAARHIVIFTIMFFIVYFGFAIAFFLAFSTNVAGFKDINDSFFSLFRSLLGDFDFAALQEENWFLGPALFVLYIFLVMFVLLNMFLAIINDAYTQTQEEMGQEDDAFALELQSYLLNMRVRWRRLWGRSSSKYASEADDFVERLDHVDADNDDKLDADELATALASMRGGPHGADLFGDDDDGGELVRTATAGSAMETAEEMMRRYDTDNDGQLDRHELNRLKLELQQRAEGRQPRRNRRGRAPRGRGALQASEIRADLRASSARLDKLEKKVDAVLSMLAKVVAQQETVARSIAASSPPSRSPVTSTRRSRAGKDRKPSPRSSNKAHRRRPSVFSAAAD